MSQFSIAGLQLALSNQDNLDIIITQIKKTQRRFPWINMMVLTELCSQGTDKNKAQAFPSKAEQAYCVVAKELGIWLITGSEYEQAQNKTYNTSSVINDKGEVVRRFRKLFPFEPYESEITAGSDIVTFDVPGGRIGLAICYDLWFPEVARAMVCEGADVLIYPTLTGTIDRPLELILSQATAISNQTYVFSINTAGELGAGQSMVVDPEGKVIYRAGPNEEVIPITVDFELTKRVRKNGTLNLGQTLKSARSHSNNFIEKIDYQSDYLNSLGPLSMPNKN